MAEGLSSDQAKTHSGPPDSLTRREPPGVEVAGGTTGIGVPARARLSARLPAVIGSSVRSNVSRNSDLKAVEHVRAGAAGVERIGSAVPEDGTVVEAPEPAVGGFGLGSPLGGLLGFLPLALGGDAARVQLGDRIDLDLGVGRKQRGRNLVGVDADGQVKASSTIFLAASRVRSST